MKDERISVPLPAEERRKLKELADKWNRSEGNAASVLLREMVERKYREEQSHE
jgi:hypothetical protein